jgi:uncharacterized LabA/DUF88 family protein
MRLHASSGGLAGANAAHLAGASSRCCSREHHDFPPSSQGTKLPHQDRLNIAVFIDFDNIEIGVKTTLGQQFDVGIILDAIKERGEVVTKIAYADWTRSGEYSRSLTQHAIRLVQRNMTPGGDKNGADINLALDALEMAFTHQHINAYVIVGGDSDFLSLVEKLKQYDKKVFVVGGRAFTSMILQRNCHEFIAYENLAGVRKNAAKIGRPMPAAAASSPVAQAVPIVRRALKILADREVSPQTGLLKSTLLQLDSTFSERNYGASSFLDFVEKLSQAGLVSLKHSGRSVMVELNEGVSDESVASAAPAAPPAAVAPIAPAPKPATDVAQMFRAAEDQAARYAEGDTDDEPSALPPATQSMPTHSTASQPAASEPVKQTESAEAGVQRAGKILGAATTARWPMYLRNVKQILRQTEGGFDERRYGFAGLMDLLKACQRDGLVRIERDRRGGLRVFQGAALARTTMPAPNVPADLLDVDPGETQPRDLLAASEAGADIEPTEIEPIPIDTTAELLGRAKPRKPRARAPRQPAATPTPRASAKPAAKPAKKAATPRKSTRKKAASSQANDE